MMEDTMTQTVLIAGASGRFGAHASTAFERAGWQVRRFDRAHDTMMEAARGVDVIVNAQNPPNYRNWETEIPRITSDVIAAAKAHGATVLVPGNVYNFGLQPGPWSDATPHSANTGKGKVRAEMERAYRASGVPTIILRAGDFIDTRASGTWLDLVILKSLSKGKFVYPGADDAAHAWAYLPDLARAAVELANKRAELERFCDVAFPGFAVTGREMAAAFSDVIGRELKVSRMGWWPIRVASPFWSLGRSLLEMRYLWDHAHWLDGGRFDALLPGFEMTPLGDALASALPGDVRPNKPVVGTKAFA